VTITDNDEMCISKEEYSYLKNSLDKATELIKELSKTAATMNTTIQIIEPELAKVSTVVLGNGDPSHGLATRMTLLENVVNVHLATHEKIDNKLWDMVKPILQRILEMAVMGGIMYLILNSLT